MNDSFFRDDLDQEKVSLKEDAVVQDKKIISKIGKYFSNDQTNAKIVLVVGVLAIILGSWHLVSGIKNAFVLSPITLEDKSGVIENLNNLKDTDGDGLSDYEEKYIYGTSPYLSDTDSDGVSDYEELSAGQEPLCAGDTCGLEDETNLEILNSDFIEKTNLDELKSRLIEAGYPITEINRLSQEDLNLIYNEVEKTINSEDSLNTEETLKEEFNPSTEELEELRNLPIDQIKLLLIEGGASNEQLESISEEELRDLYLEVLQSL
jgi:thrombospondin type 3 repeat protein